jgi:4-hydroxybutyrate CoA-transferase
MKIQLVWSKKTIKDSGMDKIYSSKLISLEEAAGLIRTGDTIASPVGYNGLLWKAIAERRHELKNVTVICCTPYDDPGWFRNDMQESFNLIVEIYLGPFARRAHDERRVSFSPTTNGTQFKSYEDRQEKRKIDYCILQVSPPNAEGFVGLGSSIWDKKNYLKYADKVIAEINQDIPPAYGNSSLHITDIDYCVETFRIPLSQEEINKIVSIFPAARQQSIKSIVKDFPLHYARMIIPKIDRLTPDEVERALLVEAPDEPSINILSHLKTLIQNGDTIQVGTGRPASYTAKYGVFDQANELGIFSEMSLPGLGTLIKNGIFTGKHCTLHNGKAVFSSYAHMTSEEREWCYGNPLVELRDSNYVVNIPNISAQHHMVAINNILQVDLTGQITVESGRGKLMMNGPGGQFEFQLGAFISKGGRAISLLYSAVRGSGSAIVPQLEAGSVITIPRTYADIIVTEWGIARLAGKSNRERAQELINIAHPDFRAELKMAARKLFWP